MICDDMMESIHDYSLLFADTQLRERCSWCFYAQTVGAFPFYELLEFKPSIHGAFCPTSCVTPLYNQTIKSYNAGFNIILLTGGTHFKDEMRTAVQMCNRRIILGDK